MIIDNCVFYDHKNVNKNKPCEEKIVLILVEA